MITNILICSYYTYINTLLLASHQM